MSSKINKSVENIKNIIIDQIIIDLKNISIDNASENEINNTIKLIEMVRSTKKSKKTIKDELKCTRLTKNGSKCNAPRSSDLSCWGHMRKDERESHVKTVKVNNKAVLKKLENLADE